MTKDYIEVEAVTIRDLLFEVEEKVILGFILDLEDKPILDFKEDVYKVRMSKDLL